MLINDSRDIIIQVLKNYTGESFSNVDEIIDFIFKIDEAKRVELIEIITEKLGKNISFDLYCLNASAKMNSMSRNCRIISAGTDFISLKSKIIKKFGLDEKDSFVNLDQISKMNLKERMDNKKEIDQFNSKYNIYEDIYDFLKNSKTENSSKKIEKNIQKIYNDFVINDVNETIINNILNNKEIYSALIIVRKDRLNALHEKLIEQIKF
jgi:hypothetical protein